MWRLQGLVCLQHVYRPFSDVHQLVLLLMIMRKFQSGSLRIMMMFIKMVLQVVLLHQWQIPLLLIRDMIFSYWLVGLSSFCLSLCFSCWFLSDNIFMVSLTGLWIWNLFITEFKCFWLSGWIFRLCCHNLGCCYDVQVQWSSTETDSFKGTWHCEC